MVMAENGKTKAELDRGAGKKAFQRFLEMIGDTSTEEERAEAIKNIGTYSPEEADRMIREIEESGRTWFVGDNGTGVPVTHSKDEMIESIRRSIRR